jgi:hypothetical protein
MMTGPAAVMHTTSETSKTSVQPSRGADFCQAQKGSVEAVQRLTGVEVCILSGEGLTGRSLDAGGTVEKARAGQQQKRMKVRRTSPISLQVSSEGSDEQ